VLRVGEAFGSRDFETYANQVSADPSFRGIGTDAEEFWASADQFLNVRRVQLEELGQQGWSQADVTVERLDAFENGPVGWASMLYTLRTPVGDTRLRATVVLVLESGAWKIVQWHTSVPTPNVQSFGVELTTTLDDLLESVAQDSAALDALAASEGTMTLAFTDISVRTH